MSRQPRSTNKFMRWALFEFQPIHLHEARQALCHERISFHESRGKHRNVSQNSILDMSYSIWALP